ncbi:hypothetical protein OnM2_013001 [Erysiphe neolycopersici]|uniref:Rab-GAP TBC domain-containing protein n=1 Tax=Erysiphe neolycopersici TaxID=212602 RepID=A0A420I5P5_9PEZI|nr:hypothetical protein OnM2_013001 [Erysiphe neolycopersici]
MDKISPTTLSHTSIVEESGFGSDFNIGLREGTKRPNTLPDDLPKSLDDRKFTSTYPLETEIYDAWKGQSEIIRLATPAKPLQYRTLSIDYGSKTPILKPTVNNHGQTNLLAADAGHRDVFIDGDENAIANDNKLSDKEKENTLQKSLNMAASNGDIESIQRILNGKAKEYVDIDAPDEEGTTPLIYASCFVSDLSEFLQDSGYNIGNVGVPDDFYNPGFSQDRFEEEMAENEMRRRMMMESARDLEVDIGNVGFDDQPETPEEHGEETQEFDWNRCLHDQMFVFQENELGRILNIVITTMTPQRSSSQKPVPANILFLSARYAHYHANQDLLAKLLITSLEKINDVVESHQWDMTILAFWISNATLLLHYLKKDGGLSESTKEFQFQLAELINEIFILIIRDAERRIDKTLDSSMLDHETIKGFEDIAFQHEWKIFKRKIQVKEEPAEKRFRPPSPKARSKPSPRNVTSLLSSTLFVLDLYDIHSVIISQILAQLLYWLGAELFNRIMSNRKYMARSKAMQIRMNVSMIEEWARSNNRQPEHYEDGSMTSSGESTIDAARNHLAPVIQLLQWLQCFSSLEQNDLEALTATIQQLTRLSPQHLIHVVKHYRPEVGEKGLPKTGIKYLNKLQKEWQDRKDRLKNSRRTSSFSHVATSKMGNNYRTSQDSERIQHDRHDGNMAPAMSPIEEDYASEGLFLDPAIMLSFTLPSGTDMLVSYGAGFGGLNRERERKYIPTIPPEFLAKLDANGDKSRSRYAEKDWENEEARSSSSLRNSQLVIAPITQTRVDNGMLTVRYEEAQFSSPPMAVTIPPPIHISIQPPTDVHPAFRTSSEDVEDSEWKRDSGLPNTTNNSSCTEGIYLDSNASSPIKLTPLQIDSHFGIQINFDLSRPENLQTPASDKCPLFSSSLVCPASSESGWNKYIHAIANEATSGYDQDKFFGIETYIPTGQWIGDGFLEQLSFSKRGSIMVDGRKAVEAQARLNGGLRQPIGSTSTDVTELSIDTERESQNIRFKYKYGPNLVERENGRALLKSDGHSLDDIEDKRLHSSNLNTSVHTRFDSKLSNRNEYELAGGIEDWENIDGCDVDRYGFIKKFSSKSRSQTPELVKTQRNSTTQQSPTDTPRRRRGINRITSVVASSQQKSQRKIPIHALELDTSESSLKGFWMDSHIRVSPTCFPSNRYRRLIYGAGDMLNFSHGSRGIPEDEEGEFMQNLKKKEWKRAEKWRKMAKIIIPGSEGMKYEFDTKSTKLIQRTWKGIPDRWRAAAWYSFLRSSSKKQINSISETDIINSFHKLIDEGSADDIQIDIDVPRTINSHIMFRKRYRGGQRLLFRVLHCLSLYFPRTGYVQGMASLAATLLCYYDEGKAFVMLVRLWTLRGMDKLYDPGFQGLIAALREFQTKWIDNRAVSKKLEDLCIEPTAYGIRWYLTLFNLSIPFSAQLRVWDVFMLLGDTESTTSNFEKPSGDGLTILHATSAALIDAVREVLLASDFDNAMKTLTGWIPIKDDELLMKVARAEWKLHQKK